MELSSQPTRRTRWTAVCWSVKALLFVATLYVWTQLQLGRIALDLLLMASDPSSWLAFY
ncbi:MAG: hypothetical protein HY329_02635 [Chloroflexi bacterium]|nr:hypothetical protein [Chloroflexota bacterium]